MCPRVNELSKYTTKPRVKVKICNMSAKTIILTPKSVLCSIQEAKIFYKMPLRKGDNRDNVNPIELGVNIERASLSETLAVTVNNLFNKFKSCFLKRFFRSR